MTATWRKSSRSNNQGDACVETRTLRADIFQVRDSKLGDASPIVSISRTNFTALLASIKSGALDG